MNRRTYLFAAAAVSLLAFALREWHVLVSVVAEPARGDVAAYLAYALNLANDGTFGQAAGRPDAFRSPGYPLFLAAIYKLTGAGGWYSAVYQAQAVVGALTVAGTIALSRQWLPRGWSLLAGGLLAVWPHHIAATNAMLLEVVFGFALIAAMLLASLALARRTMPLAVAAGLAFGCAYLINPVTALFPVALLAVFWRERAMRTGAVVALASLFVVAGWGVRNAAVGADGGQRAGINFVQGSWPDYHKEWKVRAMGYPSRTHDAIEAEMALYGRDRDAGLRSIGKRVADDPARFALWYAGQKPYLLWDWRVRIGWGGFYTLHPENSPLENAPLLMGTTALAWGLNPLLFLLAVAMTAVGLRRGGPESIVALFFLYITAVHVVLQAEPRYAIAYRGIEFALAAGGMALIGQRVIVWRSTATSFAASATRSQSKAG